MGELEAMILITGNDGVAKGWRLSDVTCTERYFRNAIFDGGPVTYELTIFGTGERLDVEGDAQSLIQQWRGEIDG